MNSKLVKDVRKELESVKQPERTKTKVIEDFGTTMSSKLIRTNINPGKSVIERIVCSADMDPRWELVRDLQFSTKLVGRVILFKLSSVEVLNFKMVIK